MMFFRIFRLQCFVKLFILCSFLVGVIVFADVVYRDDIPSSDSVKLSLTSELNVEKKRRCEVSKHSLSS